MLEGVDMRDAEHLWDIQSICMGREVEINVIRGELVWCGALILDLQMELELFRLESKQSKRNAN